jgi:hypothetical protein
MVPVTCPFKQFWELLWGSICETGWYADYPLRNWHIQSIISEYHPIIGQGPCIVHIQIVSSYVMLHIYIYNMTVYATYRQSMIKIMCIYDHIMSIRVWWIYTYTDVCVFYTWVVHKGLTLAGGLRANYAHWACLGCGVQSSALRVGENNVSGAEKLMCRSCSKRETVGCHGFYIFFCMFAVYTT